MTSNTDLAKLIASIFESRETGSDDSTTIERKLAAILNCNNYQDAQTQTQSETNGMPPSLPQNFISQLPELEDVSDDNEVSLPSMIKNELSSSSKDNSQSNQSMLSTVSKDKPRRRYRTKKIKLAELDAELKAQDERRAKIIAENQAKIFKNSDLPIPGSSFLNHSLGNLEGQSMKSTSKGSDGKLVENHDSSEQFEEILGLNEEMEDLPTLVMKKEASVSKTTTIQKTPLVPSSLDESSIPSKARFFCDYKNCGAFFIRQEDMIRHKRTHSDARPYKCRYCDFSSKRNDNLIAHERTHQARKFFCRFEFCNRKDRGFTRRDELKRHYLSHIRKTEKKRSRSRQKEEVEIYEEQLALLAKYSGECQDYHRNAAEEQQSSGTNINNDSSNLNKSL